VIDVSFQLASKCDIGPAVLVIDIIKSQPVGAVMVQPALCSKCSVYIVLVYGPHPSLITDGVERINPVGSVDVSEGL
jgi:hypothetical protein